MRADQILPDDVNHGQFNGVTIRKGTVAAFLANARTWTDARASADERALAQGRIAEDLPALLALGLFEVLQIRDARLRAFVEAVSVSRCGPAGGTPSAPSARASGSRPRPTPPTARRR